MQRMQSIHVLQIFTHMKHITKFGHIAENKWTDSYK